MEIKELIQQYIEFKNECVENKIFDLEEILELFKIKLMVKGNLNSLN